MGDKQYGYNPDAEKSILFVVSEKNITEAAYHQIKAIAQELREDGYSIAHVSAVAAGVALVKSEPAFNAIVIDWSLGDPSEQMEPGDIIREVRKRDLSLPIIISSDFGSVNELPLGILQEAREYVSLLEDTASFIAGRIVYAATQYREQLLPPYFKMLKEFAQDRPYYWDCPGHQGGVAYHKHPVGREFIRFFGENIMRADIGIATPEMGDYLEHLGVAGESESNAARIFGADETFYVVGGSSQSNQIVAQAFLPSDDLVLVDRNCHKSVNHALTLTGVQPVYLKPLRNGFGIIGPIPLDKLAPDAIKKSIANSPLIKGDHNEASHCIITNCTYDGICYNANQVTKTLAPSVPRLHFDEAWFAYAKFHPLYETRFAMGVADTDEIDKNQLPTLIAVQSTHKMLASFSASSMIHIKESSRCPVDYENFNTAFGIHGTTSPFYPMIASIDVATAMMEYPAGETLINESIKDAIAFRKTVVKVNQQLADQGEWFFNVWQPDTVTDPSTGEQLPFSQVPDEVLANNQSCWYLNSNQDWHGFGELPDSYAMMDPIKMTVTCPGINALGEYQDQGVPGPVVAKYLDTRRRTIVARTGDYTLLLLYGLGITNGKWGTFLESLFEFKKLYDDSAMLKNVFPELVKEHPEVYSSMTLKELCDAIHNYSRDIDIPRLMNAACDVDPEPVFTPAQAHQMLLKSKVEPVAISELSGRISASMITPYPPGIPVLMPGERLDSSAQAILDYLLALQGFGQKFPGFEHELQGVEIKDDGSYWIRAIVE